MATDRARRPWLETCLLSDVPRRCLEAGPEVAVEAGKIRKAEMSEAEWNNILDVNAKGTFLVNRAAVIRSILHDR